ncbi:hypothetical protein J7E73_13980 [Paenibacillus albidus]|uniref:hypothetical protein n=1 Tax=Paenibacillus albidus TaxID=2041023 RepID=UPI001BE68030|nr:hypothetical protein [Paenibacillus albidus]MBT2290229.1 hypothetical protein [Paenibacillus albidus]
MENWRPIKLLEYKWMIVITFLALGLLSGIFIFNEQAVLSGTLICGSILLSYFCLVSWSLEATGFFLFVKNMSKKDIVLSFVVFILVIAFVFAETSRDRFVYFWDFGGYWGVTIEHSRNFFIEPSQMLKSLYISINTSEYNNIIPTLLALPMKIMGESFVSYVMLILILFMFPMALVLSYCFCKLASSNKSIKLPFWVALIITLSLPTLYLPLFFGYLDGVCLLAAAILWLTVVDIDWHKYDFKKYLIISIMLLLLILQRRYFAFFAVGFILALFIFVFIKVIQEKDNRIQIIKFFMVNISFSGLICIGTLLIFFRDFLKQSLFNNFSVAYSAYNIGNYVDNFFITGKSFGLFICSLLALSLIVGIIKKEVRPFVAMFFSSFILTQIVFFRIQNMGLHHRYLLFTQLVLLVLIGVGWLYNFLLHNRGKALVVLVTILFLGNFGYSFRLIPINKLGTLLYSNESYEPKIRNDIAQLQLLANDLKVMSDENGGHIYVVASSTILNDDIIRKLYLPDTLNYILNLDASSNVDLRDGFPSAFLTADIVVVADPIQYHLTPKDQQVVGILAEEILNKGIIGKNFSFVKDYTIQQNIKVKVFKKNRQFSKLEIKYLSDQFDKAYPQFPELFKDRIESNPLP